MKQLKYKFWAKVTALTLLPIFAMLAFFGTIGTVYLVDMEAFVDEGRGLRQEINEGMIREKMNEIIYFYENADFDLPAGHQHYMELLNQRYARERTNLIYSITAADGTVLSTNATGEETRYPCTETQLINDTSITCALAKDLFARDAFRTANFWLDQLIEWMDMVPLLTAFSLILCLALFIFLLVAAGHKKGEEGIYLHWFHRIPFDLLAAAVIFGNILIIAVCMEFSYMNDYWIGTLVFIAFCGALCLLLLMALLMSFAARVKAGKWWRGTILWKVRTFVCRAVRKVWHFGSDLLRQLPGCWQLVAVVAGVSLLELIVALTSRNESAMVVIFWILERPVLVILALLLHLSFRKIEHGGKALADSDLSHQIPMDMMVPPFRGHAEHLNHIGEGMQRAVEQQTKSERTKAELITNVSHDIKTPLTSIVNYVDLLKSLDMENPTAREYLDVLERQSQRLRKLTEDLVEASKASAGSIPVELEPTDPYLLLTQAMGEYEDRLHAQQLEIVCRPPAETTMIMADGRLLWRVFDNLLGNICKYSLPGTRVYLTTEVKSDSVTMSFKNISRYALDISAEELTERFVRGDSSRSTEGSGLGLSIATSLTTLQGGKLEIHTDGDLFRADVTFPTAQ